MKRRKLLIWSLFLLTAFNGLFLFHNFAIRIKGHEYHVNEAATAVLSELNARHLLETPADDNEASRLYLEAFRDPIEPHIDPFADGACLPLIVNFITLGLLWYITIFPFETIVAEVKGSG